MKFLSDVLIKAGLVVEGSFSANAVSNTMYAGAGTRLRTETNNLVFERLSSSGLMKIIIDQATLGATAKAYLGYSNATLNVILSNEHASGGLELRTADVIRQQIFSTGNIVIGQASPVDAGYKFSVTGTVYVSSSLTANSFVKIGGTSSQYLMADGSTSTLTNPITGSGTTNYLPKFTGATTLGNSIVSINGNVLILGTSGESRFNIRSAAGNGSSINFTEEGVADAYLIGTKATSGDLVFRSSAYNFSTGTERARITSTGNFIINNASTDNGLRFQVTGDGYFSGRVHIGTTSNQLNNSFQVARTMTGAVVNNGINSYGQIQSDVTTEARYFMTDASTQAASFTLASLFHYRTFQSAFGAGSSVTNQYGFFVDSTLIGATNNYGFYGNIASGTGRWNLYMNGTADNYLAGRLGIAFSDPKTKLDVRGTSASAESTIQIVGSGISTLLLGQNADGGVIRGQGGNNALTFWTGGVGDTGASSSGTERMRLDASGNLGLGVTPSAWNASYKVIEVGNVFSLMGQSNAADLYGNLFLNTSGQYIYKTTAAATAYSMASGQHRWYVVASGTAGNTASLTANMTLGNNGNLLLGSTSDSGEKLQVNGTMRVSGASTFGSSVTAGGILTVNSRAIINGGTTSEYALNVNSNSSFAFGSTNGRRVAYFAYNTGDAPGIQLGYDATDNTGIIAGSTSALGAGIDFYTYNGSTWGSRLRIASTGAATFSSSVTAGNLTANDVSYFKKASTVSQQQIRLQTVTDSYVGQWGLGNSPLSSDFSLSYFNGTSWSTNFFTLSTTGAATFSSSVQAGGGTINTSAILQADSTTKGFLPPRMTATQRAGITSPAIGLVVYQTDGTEGLYIYTNASGWKSLAIVN